MNKLTFGLKQKFLRQRLERIPEPHGVMIGEKQDVEYDSAANRSGLNVSYEFILNTLLALSPLSGRALDIACGSGHLILRIARHMPRMQFEGIDLSDNMLALAQKKKEALNLTNIRFKKHDMFALDPYPGKAFDLITWNNTLHHCKDAEQAVHMLNSIARLAKDGGTIYCYDLCRLKTEDLLITFLDHTAKDMGDYFFNDTYDSYGAAFTYDELARILKRTQLRNVRHIRPAFFDVVQLVYASRTRNKGMRRVSYLTSREQRVDYTLLRLSLAGRIR